MSAGADYIKYDIATIVLNRSGWTESSCADILFLNNAPLVGGANVSIRGVLLAPGQFMSITSNDAELDVTQYDVVFDTAGIPLLTVIRKLYKTGK